ncbi:hypothetical protein AAG906_019388 [Vitis piasezkii]
MGSRERAVRGFFFFFRVLQKEPVGGGVCLRVGILIFEEPWREKKRKRNQQRGAEGGRRDGWSLKKIEKEAIFTLEEDYSENENNGVGPCPDFLAELGIHVGDLREGGR